MPRLVVINKVSPSVFNTHLIVVCKEGPTSPFSPAVSTKSPPSAKSTHRSRLITLLTRPFIDRFVLPTDLQGASYGPAAAVLSASAMSRLGDSNEDHDEVGQDKEVTDVVECHLASVARNWGGLHNHGLHRLPLAATVTVGSNATRWWKTSDAL